MSGRSDADIVASGREVLRLESDAVAAVAERLGPSFAEAVRTVLGAKGTVVICGTGKSGTVARKLAGTLTSTGTPAVFLHPADAAHGDVGVIDGGDVVIAISKSGEGEEILRILPVFREMAAAIIAITGNTGSSLASEADVVLDASVEREACPMDLVPTASTTAALALGDALAVAVLAEKDVDPAMFARYHPGGALGRRLLLRVADVMHSGEDVPTVPRDATMREAICEIANKRLGMVAVTGVDGRLEGIVTDGDLKRIIMRRADMLDARVAEFMTTSPRIIGRDELVVAALQKMESEGPITSLIIVDESGRPDGVIHIHDCLRAVG
ncbi:MAG: KpsF/GutQ family sugar-phosphate isomerase [Candidatus Eisenbacteria bacterium]|nr:KpsF/GutQ family sugar-phosphate isomerase [Candidatus Eisenbacteria bacterium]